MSTELAWAAGFFDGEGTFIAVSTNDRGARRVQLLMSVPQKDIRPLERFQQAVGAGHIYRKSGNHLGGDLWVWQIMGHKLCCTTMLKLEPYLSEPKKEQIAVALDKLEAYRAGLTWNRGRKNKHSQLDNQNEGVLQFPTFTADGIGVKHNTNLEEVHHAG